MKTACLLAGLVLGVIALKALTATPPPGVYLPLWPVPSPSPAPIPARPVIVPVPYPFPVPCPPHHPHRPRRPCEDAFRWN